MAERNPTKPAQPTGDHWMVRPDTIRKIWIGSLVVLALTIVAEFFVERGSKFGIDGIFGFGAWFGFFSCVVLVIGSKALGAILKRPDTYYDR